MSSNETSVNHLYLLVAVRDHCAEHVLYRYPFRGKRTSGAELLLFSAFVEIQCDTVMLMPLMYIYIYTKLVTEITGKRNNTKVKHFSRYSRSTT